MAKAKKPVAQAVQEPAPQPAVQTPVQPEPVQAQPVQPQVQPTAQVPQQGSNKAVLTIIGLVALIAAGVAGYGYWNGAQIKSYAQKAEGYMNTAKSWDNKLEFSDFMANQSEAKKVSQTFQEIKSESDKILNDLSKFKAPGKAKVLEGYLKDYFGTTKKLGEELEPVMVYIDALTKVGETMTSISDLGSSPEDVAKMKSELQDTVNDLKKLTPPEGMKDTHDKLVTSLEKIVDVFDELADAIATGDYNALMNISSDLYDIESDVDFSDSTDFFNDYDDESRKLDELEPKITSEVNSLKTVSFSF